MSRFYNLCVEFKKITLNEVKKVVCEDYGWTETDSADWNSQESYVGCLVCEGSLYGGMSEDEAHKEIYNSLKKINPICKIQTKFTYMEDLPYEEYGDDLDAEEDELKEMVEKKIQNDI